MRFCLRVVLQRIQEAGLTAKPQKCQFGMDQCLYLGHIVGNGVVCPERSKLQGVESFPTPVPRPKCSASSVSPATLESLSLTMLTLLHHLLT